MRITSLTHQKYFDIVNKKGVKRHNPSAVLVLAFNYPFTQDNEGLISLGMKVNKKLGNAVIRNKIKRRIRHLVNLISKRVDPKLRLGLIVVPRKGFHEVMFSKLEEEFFKILIER